MSGARSLAVRRLIIAGAAVAGALLAASPTGVPGMDAVWGAALAAALAYAGAYASTFVLLPAAAAAALLAGSGHGLAFAAAAAAAAAYGVTQDRPSSRLTAATGGVVALSLLAPRSGPAIVANGGAALIAIAVAISGWEGLSLRRRRSARLVLGAVAVAVIVVGLAGGVAGLRARSGAEDGIDALRAARISATKGDIDAAVAGFREAERAFRRADAPLTSYGRLARAVPGLSQQIGAAHVAVEAAAEASTALRQAGASLHLHDISLQQGAVDLAVLADAEAPLSVAVDALVDTVRRLDRVDRRDLVPPLRNALDDALDEARAAATTAERAHRSVQELPDLLGAERPTRFLVLFTSPVEARNRFGFPGAYAVVRFDNGRLSLERSGPTNELRDDVIDAAAIDVPARVVPYIDYGAARSWRSVTIPPDGPSVAEVAVQLGAQSGLGSLDGLVMADPSALAAIVGLVGPVPVPGLDVVLTADTTADFLVRRQYLEFPDNSEAQDRKDVLVEVAAQVGSRLSSLSVPSLQDLSSRFGPLVAQGHLVVSVPSNQRPSAAALLDDLGLDGGFELPDSADLLAVGQRNRVGNKIDLFLERSLRYDVAIATDGSLTADLTVDLTNKAPATGLPDYVIGSALGAAAPPRGTNLTTTLIYSPHQLRTLTVDGVAVVPASLSDGGLVIYQVEVELGPGSQHQIRATFDGVALADDYAVRVLPGMLVQPDRLLVTVADARRGTTVERPVAAVDRPHCLGTARRARC